MFQIIAFILVVIGIFTIFNGWTVHTESAVHQIYAQLISLTGVIMLTGGFIISAIDAKTFLYKEKSEKKAENE